MGLDRTYHAYQFIVSYFSFTFLFIPCGRLCWLHVSLILHVKYRLSYRIVSYGCKYCDCDKNLSYLFDDQAEDPDDEYDLFDFNRRIEISQDNDAVK